MNPWISEQLGGAHRAEMRRVARRPIFTPSAGTDSDHPRHPLLAAVTGARRSVGVLLIRVGARLGGVEIAPGPVNTVG